MTTSIISTLHDRYTAGQQHKDSYSYCTLVWRRNQLLVKPVGQIKQPYIASLDDEQYLVECLKHSPINLVRIDPKLGEARLNFWANACEKASKPIYLRVPSGQKRKPQSLILKHLKRMADWIAALVFLLAMSPLILGLVWLMHLYSPGQILEQEWRVGERGRLFRMFKFRTTATNQKTHLNVREAASLELCEGEQDITVLGRWMQRYGFQNLPLLLNVLRGEMSLTGPRCLTLTEAMQLNSDRQGQLNKLPGIVNSWQVEPESGLLPLDSQAL
ncbi:MAG: sugar transferase [Fischerella sp.]|nr:sugar transferase [Fischerella sp.]